MEQQEQQEDSIEAHHPIVLPIRSNHHINDKELLLHFPVISSPRHLVNMVHHRLLNLTVDLLLDILHHNSKCLLVA
jgi:hypothetical protein